MDYDPRIGIYSLDACFGGDVPVVYAFGNTPYYAVFAGLVAEFPELRA